jgi:hypothetical protein
MVQQDSPQQQTERYTDQWSKMCKQLISRIKLFWQPFLKKLMNYGTLDIYENKKNRRTLHNASMCKLLLYL